MKKLLLTTLFASCAFACAVMAETVTRRVCLYMQNTGSQPCAYQCDIALPNGVTIVDGTMTIKQLTEKAATTKDLGRCSDANKTFRIASNDALSESVCRVVSYSEENSTMAGNYGLVASFEVQASKTLTSSDKFVVSNLEIVDAGSNKVGGEGIVDGATIVVIQHGDANVDGVVDNKDVTIIKRAAAGKADQYPMADLNGDAIYDNKDVTIAKRISAKY